VRVLIYNSQAEAPMTKRLLKLARDGGVPTVERHRDAAGRQDVPAMDGRPARCARARGRAGRRKQ
jgi:hypothetical protein